MFLCALFVTIEPTTRLIPKSVTMKPAIITILLLGGLGFSHCSKAKGAGNKSVRPERGEILGIFLYLNKQPMELFRL
jgi:hypothetical protein